MLSLSKNKTIDRGKPLLIHVQMYLIDDCCTVNEVHVYSAVTVILDQHRYRTYYNDKCVAVNLVIIVSQNR